MRKAELHLQNNTDTNTFLRWYSNGFWSDKHTDVMHTHIYICPSILPLITHAGTATCAQVPGEEDSGPGICQLFQMAKNCGVISYELGSRVCAKPRYVRLGGDLVEPQCGNFRGGPIYVGDIQPRHVRVPWQLRRV